MVSIEENSLGDVLGTKLPKGVLAGLRGVTSPDAPAVAYAKPAEAPSYGAGEPEALAYLAQTDAAPAALNQPGSAETAPNAATLVVDNDAAQRALEQEQLEAARAAALADIDDQLAQARLDDNVPAIQRLEGEKLKVMSATCGYLVFTIFCGFDENHNIVLTHGGEDVLTYIGPYMIVGLAIYAFYGRAHSMLRKAHAPLAGDAAFVAKEHEKRTD